MAQSRGPTDEVMNADEYLVRRASGTVAWSLIVVSKSAQEFLLRILHVRRQRRNNSNEKATAQVALAYSMKRPVSRRRFIESGRIRPRNHRACDPRPLPLSTI